MSHFHQFPHLSPKRWGLRGDIMGHRAENLAATTEGGDHVYVLCGYPHNGNGRNRFG
jgi:hypothetical protein